MEPSVLATLVFLFLGAVVSHSVLPPEIYWKTMLPDVPMPKAVKELLQPGNVGNDVSDGAELDPNPFKYNGGKHSEPNAFKYNGADPNAFKYNGGKHSDPNAFKYNGADPNTNAFKYNGADPNAFKYNRADTNAFKYNGADPNAFKYNGGKLSDPNAFKYNGAEPNAFKYNGADPNAFKYNGADPNAFKYNGEKLSDPNAFKYNGGKHSEPNAFKYNAADANAFKYNGGKHSEPNAFKYNGADPNAFKYNGGKQSDPNVFDTESKGKVNDYDNIFFLEEELHPGSKIHVHLARSTMGAIFLPRQQADAISFSSDMLSKVMEKLSVKPHSMEAKIMEQTIKTCEEPAQEGEEKYCATSLESMVDFVVYKLGRNVHSISTEVGMEETSIQEYTTGLGIKRMGGANSIVCHNQAYAYPVYYCHATHSTKVYVIPFSTTEGSTTKAIAVCHTDTSKWNPEHLAFHVLKIRPGTIPVCHFLPDGHIVWTSDETLA